MSEIEIEIKADIKANYFELSEQLDKIIVITHSMAHHLITLSTVMLSVLAAFSGNIQSLQRQLLYPCLLQASLVFLAATILSGIVASHAQLRTHKKKRLAREEMIEDLVRLLHQTPIDQQELQRLQDQPRPLSIPKYFAYAFYLEQIAFFLAILCLTIFGAANLTP